MMTTLVKRGMDISSSSSELPDNVLSDWYERKRERERERERVLGKTSTFMLEIGGVSFVAVDCSCTDGHGLY